MKPGPGLKLTEDQRAEIADRYESGEAAKCLADEFGITHNTIVRYLNGSGVKMKKCGRPVTPKTLPGIAMAEFAKRARSIVWREEHGKNHPTYERWNNAINKLKKGSGYSQQQAMVQISKDYPCLKRLFREYDVSEFDPHPGSHPDTPTIGLPDSPAVEIECLGEEKSYRENLNWAMDAAGEYLRIGIHPVLCPNNQAYYLYIQATENPKDFMQRLGQVESKGDSELDEQRSLRNGSKKSIREIEEMLETLDMELAK